MSIKWLAATLYGLVVFGVSYSMFSAQNTPSGIQNTQTAVPLNAGHAAVIESGQFLADDSLQLHPATDSTDGVFISQPLRVPFQQIAPFLSVGSLWDISQPVNASIGDSVKSASIHRRDKLAGLAIARTPALFRNRATVRPFDSV